MVDLNKSGTWCTFAAAMLIGACSPSPDQSDAESRPASTESSATREPVSTAGGNTPDQSQLTIIVRGDGLLVETPGHGQPLKFEETTAQLAQAALAALGPPKKSSNAECPAGPLDFMEWTNGLQLAFQNGRLAGWWASDKAHGIATAEGLRPGSLRTALGSAPIEDTSIGKLFTIDGVNGVLDETSGNRVNALWAGAACIFS